MENAPKELLTTETPKKKDGRHPNELQIDGKQYHENYTLLVGSLFAVLASQAGFM